MTRRRRSCPPCWRSPASRRRGAAQSPAFDADFLRDLPSGRDLFSLLETAEPLTVADRIDTGGLFTGEAGRLSARGASWTQATFALDGVDLTDPLTGGRPLFLPGTKRSASVDFRIGGARTDVGGARTAGGARDAAAGRRLDGHAGARQHARPWRRDGAAVDRAARPLAARRAHDRGPARSRAGSACSSRRRPASSARFARDAREPESSRQGSLLAGLDWRAGAGRPRAGPRGRPDDGAAARRARRLRGRGPAGGRPRAARAGALGAHARARAASGR